MGMLFEGGAIMKTVQEVIDRMSRPAVLPHPKDESFPVPIPA